jgi:bacillithiol biosynthesis deacetylase BshB1
VSPIVDASDPGRWSEPLDALFLSPHPDDVELFCGGTVAKLVARGRRVGIADLTRGELSSNGSPQQRREESLTAAKILGVTLPRPVLGIADGGIDDGDEEQVRVVVEVLRAARPTLLFAPLRRDRHPDHEAAGRLARRAAFLAGLSRYPAAGSPTRPRALVHYLCHRSVEPGFLVDVSGVMESRRKAIAAYASQFESAASTAATFVNRPGFVAGREARLVAFGAEVGVDYAEAFVLSSAVCVEDPVTAFGSIEERTP